MAELPRGTKLGAYIITKKIGEGGMASVYQALHPLTRRYVAIKVMQDERKDEKHRERFKREARIIASLEHDHVLPLYDYGLEGETAYIVMPFIKQGTLNEYLKSHPFNIEEVVRFFCEMALGLEYVHQRGIVHRDLKPSNVMLNQNNHIQIADFGLARFVKKASSLTKSGNVMGTLLYMSPEQAYGERVDPRSDIYTMGLILYEMITGDPPYHDTVTESSPLAPILKRLTEVIPSVAGKYPGVTVGIDEVILKATARDAESRYQSIMEMAAALLEVVPNAVVSLPSPKAIRIPSLDSVGIVGRKALIAEAKAALLKNRSIALYGLSGIGKSIIAHALVRDQTIRTLFSGGILWANLGDDPNIDAIFNEWTEAIFDEKQCSKLKLLKDKQEALLEAFNKDSFFFIFDDLRRAEDLAHFNLADVSGAYVVTARQKSVATEVCKDSAIEVSAFEVGEGLTLLEAYAPENVRAEPDKALALVRAYGNLPLVLNLIGRHLSQNSGDRPSGGLNRELRALEQAGSRFEDLSDEVQSKLKAAISVSQDSLSAPERAALRALSVLPAKPASFSRDAADVVAHATPEILDKLVDFGLLEEFNQRYAMHQTIADYTRAELRDSQAVYQRMIEFYGQTVEANPTDYRMISLEYRNVTAAMKVAQEQTLHKAFVQLANQCYRYWEANGMYDEAATFLQSAVEQAQLGQYPTGEAEAHLNLGRIAEKRDDLDLATSELERGLAMLQDEVDTAQNLIKVHGLNSLGMVNAYKGQLDTAKAKWQAALASATQIHHFERISSIKMNLSVLAEMMDDAPTAEIYMNESAEAALKVEDYDLRSHIEMNRGARAGRLGDYDQAQSHFEKSIEWADKANNPERICEAKINLGELSARRQDCAKAEKYLQEARDLATEFGNRALLSHVLANLGTLPRECLEVDDAQRYLEESLRLVRKRESTDDREPKILMYIAKVYREQNRPLDARKFLEEALALSQKRGLDELGEELHGLLGDNQQA